MYQITVWKHRVSVNLHIIVWRNVFSCQKDHICLKFELLDGSLYAHLEDRNNSSYHDRAEVHGNCTWRPQTWQCHGLSRQHIQSQTYWLWVQTSWYRAPEVMLHILFNEGSDMWSLRLVAAELTTGFLLYPGEMAHDMLSCIIETQCQPADFLLGCDNGTGYYFHRQQDRDLRPQSGLFLRRGSTLRIPDTYGSRVLMTMTNITDANKPSAGSEKLNNLILCFQYLA